MTGVNVCHKFFCCNAALKSILLSPRFSTGYEWCIPASLRFRVLQSNQNAENLCHTWLKAANETKEIETGSHQSKRAKEALLAHKYKEKIERKILNSHGLSNQRGQFQPAVKRTTHASILVCARGLIAQHIFYITKVQQRELVAYLASPVQHHNVTNLYST